MMRVTFRREYHDIHDSNAIVVLTYDNKELGHMETPVAVAIAPLYDSQLPGFRTVGCV